MIASTLIAFLKDNSLAYKKNIWYGVDLCPAAWEYIFNLDLLCALHLVCHGRCMFMFMFMFGHPATPKKPWRIWHHGKKKSGSSSCHQMCLADRLPLSADQTIIL